MAGYHAIEYTVNSRSDVVTEEHDRLGGHAIPNTLDYIVWGYVGKRSLLSQIGIVEVSEPTAGPIPEFYREVPAQAAFCMDNEHVAVR